MESNLKNDELLNNLTKAYNERGEVFEEDALTFGGRRVGEGQVIDDVLDNIQNQIRVSERQIKLPGLSANRELIKGAVADFKRNVFDGNIKPAQTAGHDDIVVEFASAQVFNNLQASTVQNFQQTGLAGGSVADIIPQAEAAESTLAENERLFFTGDFVDLNSDAIITAAHTRTLTETRTATQRTSCSQKEIQIFK